MKIMVKKGAEKYKNIIKNAWKDVLLKIPKKIQTKNIKIIIKSRKKYGHKLGKELVEVISGYLDRNKNILIIYPTRITKIAPREIIAHELAHEWLAIKNYSYVDFEYAFKRRHVNVNIRYLPKFLTQLLIESQANTVVLKWGFSKEFYKRAEIVYKVVNEIYKNEDSKSNLYTLLNSCMFLCPFLVTKKKGYAIKFWKLIKEMVTDISKNRTYEIIKLYDACCYALTATFDKKMDNERKARFMYKFGLVSADLFMKIYKNTKIMNRGNTPRLPILSSPSKEIIRGG